MHVRAQRYFVLIRTTLKGIQEKERELPMSMTRSTIVCMVPPFFFYYATRFIALQARKRDLIVSKLKFMVFILHLFFSFLGHVKKF